MAQFIQGCVDCGEWPISENHRCPATAGPIPNWVQQLAAKDDEIDRLHVRLDQAKQENDRLITAKREVHQKLKSVQLELSELKKELTSI